MSKIETVKRWSDTAPPPEGLRAMKEMQAKLVNLDNQFQTLAQTLNTWAQLSRDLSHSQARQAIDLGSLMEPVLPVITQLVEQGRAQEARLTRMERLLEQVVSVLPRAMQDSNGTKVRDRIASSAELSALPGQVWAAKPSMFNRR